MRTQTEITAFLNQFMTSPSINGQRVEYYGYVGECLSLAKRWLDVLRNGQLNGAMGAPPAAAWGSDYWVQPPQQVLDFFDKQGYDANATYPAGSMFVNTATHHIGILIDNQPGSSTARVYEQNADTDGSPAHEAQRAKNRIDGILVIKVAAPPQAPLYVIQPITPKLVQVTPGHNKWNLGQPDFAAVDANPIELSNADTHFTAVAILHHREIPQYNYYLEDANTPHGWNVLDCIDWTPPPAPYVPIAAPNKGTPPETYEVFVTLDGFQSASDANRQQNFFQPVAPGSNYFVFARDIGMINITKDNMKAGVWINPKFNELPPVPVPTPPSLPVDIVQPDSTPVDVTPPPVLEEQGSVKKLSYDWIRGDRQPVWFHTLNVTEQKFRDLENPDTTPQAVLPPNKDIRFSMMTFKNNMNYYIPTLSLNNGNRHGIPETMLRELAPVENFLETAETDVIDWTRALIETPAKRAYQLFHDVTPRLSKAGYQAKQFVDGFKKGTKR